MKFLILFFPLFLLGNDISLDFLKDKPKSIAKDFYIWRFLEQNITSKDADIAFLQVKRKSTKILKRYKKKTKDKKFLDKQNCYALGSGQFLLKSNKCINLGLSTSKAQKLPNDELLKIAKKIQKDYPLKAKIAKIFASKYPVKEMLNSSSEVFLKIFLTINDTFRLKHLNLNYSKLFLEGLSQDKKFEYFVKFIVILNSDLTKIKNALLNIDAKGATSKANFLLALNAIEFNKKDKALKFLNNSYKKVKKRINADKILFWQYLLTKDFKYLDKILEESYEINFYSIYASEKLNRKLPSIITSVVTNNKDNKEFKLGKPFHWINKFREFKDSKDIKKVIKEFNYLNTEAQLSYMLERANNYKINYFILPYREYLKDYSIERKAMILSLARQESRFIPTAISTSYALGLMQIMPFLATHITKQLKKDTTLDDMLKADVSIEFANYHLDHDLKSLSNPLLIAYAYNGGIGFTKRMLQNGAFNTKNTYEPFYSMEKVIYDETRDYGKKVLANYIIYKKLLGEKIKISTILNNLVESTKLFYVKGKK